MQIKKLVILTSIAIILILLAIGIIIFDWQSKSQYKINYSSQTVVEQIQSLNRIETASFTIEKIIDAGTTGNYLDNLLFGDKILLIAHGKVIAGFDLSKIKKGDIQVVGDSLTINMPPPEILISTLDNDQTRVYDRQTGLLTKGNTNLESEARSEAEKIITDAACKGDILQEATANAKIQLTSLFKTTGFKEITLNIPTGECK